jgi:transcriptional regulator with XRE-family HTH domain
MAIKEAQRPGRRPGSTGTNAVEPRTQSARIVTSGPKLGTSVSDLRRSRGLTLKRFSDLTGVSVSALSKIENNQTGLSFETVLKIVAGLNISVDELLVKDSPLPAGRRALNRAGTGVKIANANYEYEIFSTELAKKKMVPLITTVKARDINEWGEFSRHRGEEWMYVLSGSIRIYTEFYAPTDMHEGDSIYIDSAMGHAMVSISEFDARVLSVCFGELTSRVTADLETMVATAS